VSNYQPEQLSRLQKRTVKVLALGQAFGGFGLGATLSVGALLAVELSGTTADIIPTLLKVRAEMTGGDLAAADQALVMAYLMTGRKKEAVALAEAGIAKGGRLAEHYRRLRAKAGK
jgi:hypothetical protein